MKGSRNCRSVFPGLLAVSLIASCVFAEGGALSEEAINKIRGSFEMDAHTRAMYNSITNNDISGLAVNRDILREHNDLFSHKIKTKGVTNQKNSGRCWPMSLCGSRATWARTRARSTG